MKKKQNNPKENDIVKNVQNQRQKRQDSGFSSHCNFPYAGGDEVNQAAKVVPGVIKAATNDINNIVTDRINQIISQGGQEVERVLRKLLGGAIEDIYQTPFRLLVNFGKITF